MPEEKAHPEEPRRYWREKLDEHEKTLNTLLMGLAGGLLAFSADYVKDSVASLTDVDRALAAAAGAGASVSLAFGALRAWLRTRLYGAELSSLDYEDARTLSEMATT